MLGCFIIIVIYVVLGFLLAWIAAMVAKEEVEVKTGVVTLIASGVLSVLADYGLRQLIGGYEAMGAVFICNLAILTLMINLIAKLSWKHSAIIAVIYTVLITAIMFGLTTCAASQA